MMEESITITGNGNICLEGVSEPAGNRKAGCWPIPIPFMAKQRMPLICRMAACFQSAGIATLRFNFRGTCGSSGEFDNGRGEQDDVRNALAFLSDQGYDQLFLADTLFGSWVNAHVVSAGVDVCDHIMKSCRQHC